MSITILDLAKHRGVKEDENGGINGAEFARVDLAIFGGCARCAASLAAYNAYPTDSGYWMCSDCVGDNGFATCEDAEALIAATTTTACYECGSPVADSDAFELDGVRRCEECHNESVEATRVGEEITDERGW